MTGQSTPSQPTPGQSTQGPRTHGPPTEGPPSPSRSERDQQAREALKPLGRDERPPALWAAIVVCGVLAVAVIVGALTIHGLSRHGGSLPGGVFLAGVFAALALGMYRRRYWAVLAFEAVLAFQVLVTSLALVVAETVRAAVLCLVGIVFGGWLFWKLVRVMGRIQAGESQRVRR